MTAFSVCPYNAAVLAGCTYMVGWMGWSPWWYLLAVASLASSKSGSVE